MEEVHEVIAVDDSVWCAVVGCWVVEVAVFASVSETVVEDTLVALLGDYIGGMVHAITNNGISEELNNKL